jgi:hypothetical protein
MSLMHVARRAAQPAGQCASDAQRQPLPLLFFLSAAALLVAGVQQTSQQQMQMHRTEE